MVGCESCNNSKKIKRDICNIKFGTIKNIIAVISGKGGVGKSTVSGLLATELRKAGHEVGILDADVTGPSIPRFFGVNEKRSLINPEPYTGDAVFEPVITTLGLKIMSLNLLVDKEDDPVIWTSSVVHKVLKQMYTDTKWGDLDYLIIDMPPGTGGISITIMNTFPIDGLLVVGTPQDMVSVIVKKVINMAEKLSIPMIGLVENMAYVTCTCCGEKIKLFSNKTIEQYEKYFGIPLIAELPMDLKLLESLDEGTAEEYVFKITKYKDLFEKFMDRYKEMKENKYNS